MRTVEAQVRDGGASLATYMDDRSFQTTRWEGVEGRISCWARWSAQVGLKEAPEKVQVAARGAQYVQILNLKADAAWHAPEVKALGASTVSRPCKLAQVEEVRLSESRSRAALLMTTQLPWERMLLAHRAFVTSKASYGWVGRFPTKQAAEKLFTMLSRGFRTGYLASRDLRKVLYGTTVHLSTVVVLRAWQQLRRANDRGLLGQWHNVPHTTLCLVRRHLKAIGFSEQGPWRWAVPQAWRQHVPASERCLDLRPGSRQQAEEQLHALRQQMRRSAFENYLASTRHEAVKLVQQHSMQALFRAFSSIDIPRTRKALGLGPGYRAAFLASTVSPEHLYRAGGQGETGVCPFCRRAIGYHAHLLWGCRTNARPPGVGVPANPLTRRLGWVSPRDGWDASVHVAETACKLWASRHARHGAAGRS